jgi:rhodanese-related sulfurtransferase
MTIVTGKLGGSMKKAKASMSGREFRVAIYEQFARIGKALSSPSRLELMDLLCQGPHTVEQLATASFQTLANTSQHLQILKAARLVEADKSGLNVIYSVAGPQVVAFTRSLQNLGRSRLAEVELMLDEFLEDRGVVEVMDRDRLLEEAKRGKVTVIDVRPTSEYQAGHLPGAISIPFTELERRLSELPRSRRIVAYCRGRFCVMSIEAVRLLQKKGFKAIRLEESIIDWAAAGLPLEHENEIHKQPARLSRKPAK